MKALFLCAAIFAASISIAAADYKEHYASYLAAFETGDAAAALAHGEAAWRAAEEELGDHATTAILAYNYARLAIDYAPAKSLEAFERARAITEAGHGALDSAELALFTAALALTMEPDDRKRAIAAEEAFAEAEESSLAYGEAYFYAARALANRRLHQKRYGAAQSFADKALVAVRRFEPPAPRLLAESLFLAAITRLADPRRREEDMIESARLLYEMFPLFPPQKDIDTFDPMLAQAMAWTHSMKSITHSVGGKKETRTGSRLERGEDLAGALSAVDDLALDDQVRFQTPKPAYCENAVSWEKREPPSYPPYAANVGYIGAIVIGYDLNDTGVARALILSDFNAAGFGEGALKSMERWRLKEAPPEECRKNRLTVFIYAVH